MTHHLCQAKIQGAAGPIECGQPIEYVSASTEDPFTGWRHVEAEHDRTHHAVVLIYCAGPEVARIKAANVARMLARIEEEGTL